MNRLRAALVATVIPWIPAVPPAAPAPALAPPCAASALHASALFQGATGSWVGAIVLTNDGTQPCSLAGRPTASFVDGASNPAGVVFKQSKPIPSSQGEIYPSLRSLAPGAAAFVSVWWSNWCGTPSPNDLELTLTTGTIVVPVDGTARCDAPSDTSTVSVTPFEPRGVPSAHTTQLPLAAAIVEQLPGKKNVPGIRARLGTIAVFEISLTNTSNHAFRFGATCPTYVEGTGFDEPDQLHVLNCRAAGAIRPGQSVVFEMHVRVTTKAKYDRIPLDWTLAPTTYLPPFAGGVIQVER